MTIAKPPRERATSLPALIRAGASIRPLSARERARLFLHFAQRLEDRRRKGPPRYTVLLGAALSLLVAGLAHMAFGGHESHERAELVPRMPVADRSAPSTPSPAAGPRGRNPAVPRTIPLGGRAEITLEGDAMASLVPSVSGPAAGPQIIELQSGRLNASVAKRAPDEPLSIVTPQVSVVVVGTRFSVEVVAGVTTVSVEHGKVRVEREGRAVFVGAGESLRSDDERLATPAFATAPASAAPRSRNRADVRCTSTSDDAGRARCMTRVARGRGLAAENALVSLALHDADERGDDAAALAHLREYERRFPRGVLAREVALTKARILVAEGRTAEACADADRYLVQFPDDEKTAATLRTVCSR